MCGHQKGLCHDVVSKNCSRLSEPYILIGFDTHPLACFWYVLPSDPQKKLHWPCGGPQLLEPRPNSNVEVLPRLFRDVLLWSLAPES